MIYSCSGKALKNLLFGKNSHNFVSPVIYMQRTGVLFLFMIFVMINFTGCCIYSFSGASVPEHLRSIAIPVADDRSGSGEPNLREFFTNELIQKFIDDNTLAVGERVSADAVLETVILSITHAPAIVAAGEEVESMRATVSVKVVYRDLVKRLIIYEKTFSNTGDYPSGASLEVRQEAIQLAIDRITDDILLQTVSGW